MEMFEVVMKHIINKYNTFLKYIFVAGISFLIDISLFTMFNSLIKLSIIISTIIARIISSFINFILNKNKVFKSNSNKYLSFIKYYLLVAIQMFVSAFLVNTLHKYININPTIIKVPVEGIIFIVNYIIQKLFIFRGQNEN